MTEHQTVEYKQVWKDEYLKWICGFANAQGGVLVIERIMQACADEGVPTPEVSSDVNGLWMTFRFLPEHQLHADSEEKGSTSQEGLGEKLGEKLGENRQRILDAMHAEPTISIRALAQALEMSSTAIENNIRWLKKHGLIRRVGPAKGGYWEVLKS